MDFIKLKRSFDSNEYDYCYASSKKMDTLSIFLCLDLGFKNTKSIFHEWIEADKSNPRGKFTYTIGGNVTFLEEVEDDYIYITETIGAIANQGKKRNEIKILRKQLLQLLNDWQEKVCKHKPKEVTITYDNDQFTIETH